jgi:hypothetical protein
MAGVIQFGPPPATVEEGLPELSPFPVEVLPPVFRELADQSAEVFQVPVELPAMIALGTLSGALGKSFEIRNVRNGISGFGNLYIIAAAERGTGKGAVARQIVAPVLEASSELAVSWKASTEPTARADEKIFGAKLAATLAEAKKAFGSDLERLRAEAAEIQIKLDAAAALTAGAPSLWAGNATSEALAGLLSRSGETALIYSPEAGDVLRVMAGRYRSDGQADFDLLLSGYSSEPFRQDRQTRASVDICPTLSAVLLVQPSIVREVLGNPEALERGLIARCLMFDVSGTIAEDDGIHREISPRTLNQWGDLIRKCLALRAAPGEPPNPPSAVTCDPAARELFRAYHNQTVTARNGEFADIQGELSRCRENAARVALAVAIASRGPSVDTLTAVDAEAGIAIVRWATVRLLRLLEVGRRERSQERFERLCKLLVDAGKQKTLRELANSNGFTPAEVHALAAKFPAWLLIEKRQTGGRPTETAILVK